MKKTLLKISVILLAVTGVILTSCDQPQSVTETYPWKTVEKPALSAEAWPGAVVLSWTPVANVSGYKLVRKDNATQLSSTFSASDTHYVDQAGFNSTLKNEGSYTYYVEGIVGSSGNDAQATVVNSISDPVNVTANVPARDPSIVFAPAAADVTVGPYVALNSSNVSTDFLEAYWNVGADAEKKEELLFNYTVEYIYGDGQVLPLAYGTNTGLTTPGPYTKSVAFPLVGGNSTVKITASWKDRYYAPDSVTKAYTGTPTLLPAVSNLAVSGAVVDGSIVFTWDAVTGATGYDVYKAEITQVGTGLTTDAVVSSASALAGSVIGAYTAVTPSPDAYQNVNTVYFTDAEYDSSKVWLYIVIAKNAAARSVAPALYARNKTTPSVTQPSTFTLTPKQDIDGSWKVPVTWTKAEGATYKLFRAEIQYETSTSTVPNQIGAYVEIPAAELKDTGLEIAYIDTVGAGKLTLAKSYRYKIVAAKNGATQERTGDLNTAPFTRFVTGTGFGVVADSALLYNYRITLDNPVQYNNLTHEVWYAESYGGQATSGWTKIDPLPALDENNSFAWPAPDTRKGYFFRHVVKSGTVTLSYSSGGTSGTAGSPVYAKTAGSVFTNGAFSGAILTQSASTVVVQLNTLSGVTASDYAANATYRAMNGVKIYRAIEEGTTADDFGLDPQPVATVLFNASANTQGTVSGVTANIPGWTFYIVLPKYNTFERLDTINSTENWVFGTEDGSSGSFTAENYYTIEKTSAAAANTAVTVTVQGLD
jgi:hypothetical protein